MSRRRILVVEDDRSVRQLYKTALLLEGFDVETASDGLDALRKLDEQRPDLIVLDLHMPGVDGLAVLDELRANSNTLGIPVVIVTGTDYPHAIVEAPSILKKPCEPEALITVIEHHLQAVA